MAQLPEDPHLIDLIDEDGTTVTFEHLDTVRYRDKDYAVCIPYDDDEDEVTEVVVFHVDMDKEDDCLAQVDDPALLDAVYDLFKQQHLDEFDFED